MTKANRVGSIFQSIIMILFSLALIISPENSISIVIGIVGFGLTLKGLGVIIYYFRMAKSMVGGKLVLYRGIIFLDLGIFTSSLANDKVFYITLYIAIVNAFAGLVALLRARESKLLGSPKWIFSAVYGIVLIILVTVAIISCIKFDNIVFPIYIYSASLLYSAIQKITAAFKRTAIAYIP